MNHAFLILAHDSPELLQRIVDRIQAPNHFVFVHLDKNSNSRKVRIKYGRYVSDRKRIAVNWGGYSMIKAELLLLREALSSSVNFDYFHLISGHDYPCVDKDSFDIFFEQCPERKSYMYFDTYQDLISWPTKSYDRVNKWFFDDAKQNNLVYRAYHKFLFKFVKRKYKGGLYSGWQWFSWHRSLVEWVMNYRRWHYPFFLRFHYTSCCDEIVFHTLLYPNIEKLNIENYNSLRYIDWRPNRPAKTLPLVLDERDYQSIMNSGSLFCRKVFLDKSAALLDMLDSHSDRLCRIS